MEKSKIILYSIQNCLKTSKNEKTKSETWKSGTNKTFNVYFLYVSQLWNFCPNSFQLFSTKICQYANLNYMRIRRTLQSCGESVLPPNLHLLPTRKFYANLKMISYKNSPWKNWCLFMQIYLLRKSSHQSGSSGWNFHFS